MHTGKDRSESVFLLSTHTDIGFTAHGLSDINAIAGCLLVKEINLEEAIVIMCLLNEREQKEKRSGSDMDKADIDGRNVINKPL